MSRETTFQFRVSTEEREQIRQRAKLAKISDSAYVRTKVFEGVVSEHPMEIERVNRDPIPDAAPTVAPDETLSDPDAIERRAKQIYGEQGVPLGAARRMAHQEMKQC